MPRRARLVIPHVPAHIVHRGNNRTACFEDHSDCQLYLALLAHAAERYNCSIHAYVLMTNHVHLLATSPEQSALSAMMKRTAEVYAMSFNRRHHRTGTLWEGRFHSSVVQSERYLFACYRYVEMNPVRAGIVARPEEYRWSSAEANGWGGYSFVQPHELYVSLGSTPNERQKAYRDLFELPEDEKVVGMIRQAIRGGFALGDAEFTAELESRTGRRAAKRRPGRKPRAVEGTEGEAGKQFEMWSVP